MANYYTPPQIQQNIENDKTKEVMSVGKYIKVFILSAIPVINLICWIVWLTSSSTNKNLKNYIIAQIVMVIIGALVSVIIFMCASALGITIFNELLEAI